MRLCIIQCWESHCLQGRGRSNLRLLGMVKRHRGKVSFPFLAHPMLF
jgi:hypothetical protein